MTYPVDDAGNPRVDFAWGNMPMQPNDQRTGRNTGNRYMNGDWMVSPAVGSDALATGWQEINRNTGDGYQNEINRYRADIVIYDSHEIAVDNYNGFPGLNYGSPYGDLIPNATMPNLAGLTPQQAGNAIANAGITGSVNSVNQTSGATSGNNGKIVAGSQSPAAGEVVNIDTTVSYAIYTYSDPVNHTIAGIRKNFGGSNNAYGHYFMFLQGRNHNLTNGNTLTISGCDVSGYNGSAWIVLNSTNDDAFNTGGTKVEIFWNGAELSTADASTGTYTKTN